MSVYGTGFFAIKKNSPEKLETFGSIVYEEYFNSKSLLETCIDGDEKRYLQEKVDILYEVSFKDIIDKIRKIFQGFIEFVKGIIRKFKEFFNIGRAKKLEKEIDDLKKEIKDLKSERDHLELQLNRTVGANSVLKDEYEAYKKGTEMMFKDQLKKSNDAKEASEKAWKEIFDKAKSLEAKASELDKEKADQFSTMMKQARRIDLANMRLTKTLADLSDNSIIYFDVFDYTYGNSPTKLHIGKTLMNLNANLEDIKIDVKDSEQYGDISRDDIDRRVRSKLSEYSGKILDPKYLVDDKIPSADEFRHMINNKLEENKDKMRIEFLKEGGTDKFINFLEGCQYADQSSMMNRATRDLNDALNKADHIISSYKPEFMSQDSLKIIKEVTGVYRESLNVVNILTSYASKAITVVDTSMTVMKAITITN